MLLRFFQPILLTTRKIAVSRISQFSFINDYELFFCFYGEGKSAVDRLVLQQVYHSLGLGKVIDRDEVDLGIGF